MKINGRSIGGIETSFKIKQLNVMFDIGYCDISNLGIDNLFLSHTHGDHLNGLTKYLGLRELNRIKNPLKIYIYHKFSDLMNEMLNNYANLSESEWKFEIIPIFYGDLIEFRNHTVKIQKNHHRIEGCAFTVFEKRTVLKDEFKGFSFGKIKELKNNGIEINTKVLYNLLSYTGDTTREIWNISPEILYSKILIQECTYYNEERNKAFNRGHIDFSDIKENISLFNNEKILLSHYSGKYNEKEIKIYIESLQDSRFQIFHEEDF